MNYSGLQMQIARTRMHEALIPKLVYEYISTGRRNVDRPKKDGRTNIYEEQLIYPVAAAAAADYHF
jgi:hypothetical protein